jgi:Lon protease (S16) C-terminal proteolytic domain
MERWSRRGQVSGVVACTLRVAFCAGITVNSSIELSRSFSRDAYEGLEHPQYKTSDIKSLQVDVSYRSAGNGPSLSTDHHFMDGARQALAVAVMAAAKATQYDPRFLTVQLTMPMVAGSFHSGTRVDGPSAGAAWSVAVTSALLGDPLRSDVCFSGTIDEDLVIGPVGGLEHTIEGCHLFPQFHELLLPAGQQTFAIADKGMARSIKVTEISTLAEAYEVVTGQPLRPPQ